MKKENQVSNPHLSKVNIIYGLLYVFIVFVIVVFFGQLEEGHPLKPIGTSESFLIVGAVLGIIVNYARLRHLAKPEQKQHESSND